MTSAAAIAAASAALEAAQSNREPIDPIAAIIGPEDLDAAYRTQQAQTGRRLAAGARIVGRKIGLTSEAVQRQIGVDRPDFGVLFDDMSYDSGELIPIDRLLQPRAEAEVAFLLGSTISVPVDADSVRSAVAFVFPAIEVVDSRIRDWRIGIVDTIADNASSGVFVIAGEQGVPLAEAEPAEVVMRMRRNGDVVSEGDGRACLGDPLNALAWLANTAIDLGDPLRAGDLILSGALGPMVQVMPGDEFVADIEPIGSVIARFSGKDA